jgi:hypothetical protein
VSPRGLASLAIVTHLKRAVAGEPIERLQRAKSLAHAVLGKQDLREECVWDILLWRNSGRNWQLRRLLAPNM